MAGSIRDFVNRVKACGVIALNDPHLKSFLKKWVADASAHRSAEKAAQALVEQGLLNDFQAKVLLDNENIPLAIGEYVVDGLLGRGGMGFVLKARHRRMKRDVAIKFLRKELTSSEAMRKRFEREVEAAARLNHQNIVTAYDAGEHTDGSCYLVMQLVEGDDLSRIVRKNGPFNPAQAVNLIIQAADGLAYAHEHGIVHRDIKPGNLLLDRRGVLRILDMGLARVNALSDSDNGQSQAELTETGNVMGTVDYMAPEQAVDTKSADHRSDMYSLGATLYFLITGNPPFRGDSMMNRLMAHREQAVPSLRSFNPMVPRELEEIFQRLMANSKEDRYPSMLHLLVALRELELDDANGTQFGTMDDDESGSRSGTHTSLSGMKSASRLVPLPMAGVQAAEPTASRPQSTTARSNPLPQEVSSEATQTIEEEPTAETDTVAKTKPRRPGRTSQRTRGSKAKAASTKRPLWIAAAGLVGALLLGLIVIKITKKDGTVTQIQVPAGTTVDLSGISKDSKVEVSEKPDEPTAKTPPTENANATAASEDPDRHAAEWVLSKGGSVTLWLPGDSDPRKFLAEHNQFIDWKLLAPSHVEATNDMTLEKLPDHSIRASGNADQSDYTAIYQTDLKQMTGIRLEVIAESPEKGCGFAPNKNFFLNEIELFAAPKSQPNEYQKVELSRVKASYSQSEWPATNAIDGVRDSDSGWTVFPAVSVTHWLTIETKKPIGFEGGTIVKVVLAHQCPLRPRYQIACFRVSLTEQNPPLPLGPSEATKQLAEHPEADWPMEPRETLTKLIKSTHGRYVDIYGNKDGTLPPQLPTPRFEVTRISLGGASQVTDDDLQHLRRLVSLRILDLLGTSVEGHGLRQLKDSTLLEYIALHAARTTDSIVDPLLDFPRLKEIHLSETKVSDDGIRRLLKSSHNLMDIGLSSGSTSACIDSLPAAKRLTHLGIKAHHVSPASAEILKSLPSVSSYYLVAADDLTLLRIDGVPVVALNLDHCYATEKGIAALSRLPKLRRLQLRMIDGNADEICPSLLNLSALDRLVFETPGVSDRGVETLSAMINLSELLLLQSEKVTDASVSNLGKLQALRRLEIKGTKITADGVTRLRELLSQCHIESDHGTFKPK